MSRRDSYHHIVREALESKGWIITDDPLDLSTGGVELLADLGAERLLAAQKGTERIAIEVKSFLSQSLISEFHKALGQYQNYRFALSAIEPEHTIWLAVPKDTWEGFFQRTFIQEVIQNTKMYVLVVDIHQKSIVQWIKP